jgi:hypothetical protein
MEGGGTRRHRAGAHIASPAATPTYPLAIEGWVTGQVGCGFFCSNRSVAAGTKNAIAFQDSAVVVVQYSCGKPPDVCQHGARGARAVEVWSRGIGIIRTPRASLSENFGRSGSATRRPRPTNCQRNLPARRNCVSPSGIRPSHNQGGSLIMQAIVWTMIDLRSGSALRFRRWACRNHRRDAPAINPTKNSSLFEVPVSVGHGAITDFANSE